MDHRRPMPNMGGQFHGQGQGQGKQPASSGFSLMNIVPVYTLLVVGYAIYIWFKGARLQFLLKVQGACDKIWLIFMMEIED